MFILAFCLLATPALAEEPWVQEQEQDIAQNQPDLTELAKQSAEFDNTPLFLNDGPIVVLNLSAEDRRVIGFALMKRKKWQAETLKAQHSENAPLDPHQIRAAYDALTGKPIRLMEAVPLHGMLLTARNMKAVALAREKFQPAIRDAAKSMQSAGY